MAHFVSALEKTRSDIRALSKNLSQQISGKERALFDAYVQILESQDLMEDIIAEIHNGFWAQGALKHVILKYVGQFEAMDDPYLRERAADIRDLGQRILTHLQLRGS